MKITKFPFYSHIIFPTGLQVFLYKNNKSPLSVVEVGVKAGLRYEDPQKRGIAAILSHMILKHMGYIIASVGGKSLGEARKEGIYYNVIIPQQNLDQALDYLSTILATPVALFTTLGEKENLEIEKRIVIEEINNKSSWFKDYFDEIIWGKESAETGIMQTKETIKSVTYEDVAAYFGKYYGAGNMVVTIAGDYSEEQVGELTGKHFLKVFEKGGSISIPRNPPLRKDKYLFLVNTGNNDRVEISIRFLTGIHLSHPDRFIIRLIATFLDTEDASQMDQLGEKLGLHHVDSGIRIWSNMAYLFFTSYINTANSYYFVTYVIMQIRQLQTKLLSKEILDKIKARCFTDAYIDYGSIQHIVGNISRDAMEQSPVYFPEDIIQKIANVTAEDVQRAANQYLTKETMYILIAGSTNAIKDKEEQLKQIIEDGWKLGSTPQA